MVKRGAKLAAGCKINIMKTLNINGTISAYLKGMDNAKKKWYVKPMKDWKKKDYGDHVKYHFWVSK